MGIPQIGYDNLFTRLSASLSASSEVSGYPKENALDYLLGSSWRANDGASAWIAVDLGASATGTADYCALYGWSIDSTRALKVQTSADGTTWTTVATGTGVTLNDPIGGAAWLSFAAATSRYWRVRLENTGTMAGPGFAFIALGQALVPPLGMHVGYTPPWAAREVDALNVQSEGGILLGRTVINRGYKHDLTLDTIDPSWWQASWLPFMRHAEGKPFFYNWPAAAAGVLQASQFCWAEGQLKKPQNHHQAFMNGGLSFRGVA